MDIPWWVWLLLAVWMAPGLWAVAKLVRTFLKEGKGISHLPEPGEPPPPKWERPARVVLVPVFLVVLLVFLLGLALAYPVLRIARPKWRWEG